MRKAVPELMLLFVTLSLSTACGAKGEGDDDSDAGSGGTGATGATGGIGGTGSGGAPPMAMKLYGFDTAEDSMICPPPVTGNQSNCWSLQSYRPSDANYVNVFADPEDTTDTEAMMEAQELRAMHLTWDSGNGDDGASGRLKLEIPFTAPNQLADIQFNFTGEMAGSDWLGKILRADVMVESGCSADASNPCGSYLLAKTTPDYIWGRGNDTNLGPTSYNVWQKLNFSLDQPNQNNMGFDAAQVISIGVQVFSGAGTMARTTAVVYVDNFTLE